MDLQYKRLDRCKVIMIGSHRLNEEIHYYFLHNITIFLSVSLQNIVMSNVILKLEHSNVPLTSREGKKINKIVSSISPSTLIRLVNFADNKINPRTASVNAVTTSIYETLDKSPELFWYKTKGILIATKECQLLDRNRIKISFDQPIYEGIMDGGHNTFAIARFIVDKLFGVKFKKWDECKAYWLEHYDNIVEKFKEVETEPRFQFSIPVEILYPDDSAGSLEDYYDAIAEICSARNNNIQLKETAKGNQVGCYDYLKDCLSNYSIIWKTGDAGSIKSEDVIAMADIPLYFLQEKGLLPEEGIRKFNRVNLYSQKGQCISFFNEVIKNSQFSVEEKGKFILTSPLIKSALNMTEDIMKLFDQLYINFPSLYNKNNGSFGRIVEVKNKKSKVRFNTTDKDCEYLYPDGYIYPLISGVVKLMIYDDTTNTIKWKINPSSSIFDVGNLNIMKYTGWIKQLDYNPQKVGKTNLMYMEADEVFNAYMTND